MDPTPGSDDPLVWMTRKRNTTAYGLADFTRDVYTDTMGTYFDVTVDPMDTNLLIQVHCGKGI